MATYRLGKFVVEHEELQRPKQRYTARVGCWYCGTAWRQEAYREGRMRFRICVPYFCPWCGKKLHDGQLLIPWVILHEDGTLENYQKEEQHGDNHQ